MHVRELKIIRDILARKRRTFLISTGIFIGVAGTIALFAMGDVLLSQLRRDLDNDNIAMLNTFVAAPQDTTLPNDAYIEYIESIIGLTHAEGSVRADVVGQDASGSRFEAVVYGYDEPMDSLDIEPLRLIEGDYPSEREFAVEVRFAREYGMAVGDRVQFIPPDSEESIGFTVSGVVLHAYNLTPEAAIFASLSDANEISSTNGYNVITSRFVDFETARRTADHLSTVLLHDTPYTPVQYHLQNPTYNPMSEGVQRITRTINLLAILALLMSGFSVLNVINKIVREQKRQIGLLKVMGATRLELMWIFMGIAFVYGLLGVVPGIMVGVPAGYALSVWLAPEVNTVIAGFTTSLRAIGIGMALGLVVPVLSAIIPVLRGTQVSILRAITDRGIDENYHNGVLSWCIHRLPFPLTFRMGLHELNKKKTRLTLTITALSIAAGSFMGILAVFHDVNEESTNLLNTVNTEVVSDVNNPYELTAALRLNIQLTALDADRNLDIGLRRFDPIQNAAFIVDEGKLITDSNEVIVSRRLAQESGKSVSDSITINLGTSADQFTIVGIAPFPIEMVWVWHNLLPEQPRPNTFVATLMKVVDGDVVQAVGFDDEVPGLLTYTEGNTFSAEQPGILLSDPLADRWGLVVGDIVTLQGVDGELTQPVVGIFKPPAEIASLGVSSEFAGIFWEDLATIEGYALPTEATSTTEDLNIPSFSFLTLLEDFSVNLRTYEVLLSAIALLIAIVGGLGLLTTLSLSVVERQREIGVMRSIGAGSNIIAAQFVMEGLAVGFVAWLIGLPLSLWISERLLIVSGLSELFEADLRPDAMLYGFVGVMVISGVASLWPALIAATRTVSDILRYQ